MGEEPGYDYTRHTSTRKLTVSVEETMRYRGRYGIEEILGKVIIRPYVLPLTETVVKETEPSGGVGTRTSAHTSTPDELKAILHVLTNSAGRDPRVPTWEAVLQQ